MKQTLAMQISTLFLRHSARKNISSAAGCIDVLPQSSVLKYTIRDLPDKTYDDESLASLCSLTG